MPSLHVMRVLKSLKARKRAKIMLRLKIKCDVKELENLKEELESILEFVKNELTSDRVSKDYEDELIKIDRTLIELDDFTYIIMFDNEWK